MFTQEENEFSPLFLAKTTSPLFNSANLTPDDAKPVKLTQISSKFQHLAHPRTVSERDAYAGKDVKKALYMTNFKQDTQDRQVEILYFSYYKSVAMSTKNTIYT